MPDVAKFFQIKINKTALILMAAVLIASGLFIPKVFGAGGGDPCADGIPDASFLVSPGTKAVGATFDVAFNGTYSVACDSPIVNYEWDFGDGFVASGATINHQYQVGTFRPSLTITDEQGLTNARTYYTDIIVKADNQAPVLTNASATVGQGEDSQFSVAGNASDPDGDEITYGFFLPGVDQFGSARTDNGYAYVEANGTVSFHAYPDASGQETFEIGVRDGFGGEATANVTVTIDPRLTAVDDNAQTYKNTPITINVRANDFSYQDEPFNVTWPGVSGDFKLIDGGSVQINPDGTITFTPNETRLGAVSFDYNISKNVPGNYYTSRATVNVQILPPPNFVPVAISDSLSVDEDTSGNVNVLANDFDQEGDILSATLVSGPQNGTTNLSTSGTLNYTPDANYSGSDSVTYRLTDGAGNTSTGSVVITVNSINDNPVAGNDSAIVDEDGNVVVNVLTNDIDVENGSNLTAQIVSAPTSGTVNVNANGTVTYTPTANYNGNDSFTYRVTDADGASHQATVSITINSINDGPTAFFGSLTNPSGRVAFDASGSSDVDGQIVSYRWNFGDGQNTITTTPAISYKYKGKGTYQVVLTVTDNQGLTATYTKTVSI